MPLNKDLIAITDIGSTTTKAVLLDVRSPIPELLGIAHSPTTVEAPANDVRFGIKAALAQLEQQTGKKLLLDSKDGSELAFVEDVAYFSTSSAGGGLQILVIGLTLFDSASSAKRCAYGAGGVILDTFALDDKRQAMEQMLAMRNLHPDMILICGGTDGGAVSGVLRLAEIVRIANPAPKFATGARIPAIYAGNQDAAPIIKNLISDSFELYILPNLRPDMESENLQPTQNKIQQLFMENVMEHAPGYAEVKPAVAADILPTPLGVQKFLGQVADKDIRNIFAYDIGGATTDVFSHISGCFQRTVSANLGMSYSAWNVLRECGMENVLRWLPETLDEDSVRNYIANKCLHPTSNPEASWQFRIEHALAREALSLAIEQHRQMHYNYAKLGFLDKLKKDDFDKYEKQFEFQREEEKYRFRTSDIDVLIGAGGIFAHAQNPRQCAIILIDAFLPKGITEIWIDKQFISPHLGVLSGSEPETARSLIYSECVDKLALHIAPVFSPKTAKTLMHVEINSKGQTQKMEILPGSFHVLPAGKKTISLHLTEHARISTTLDIKALETELPVYIDARTDPAANRVEVERILDLYPAAGSAVEAYQESFSLPATVKGEWIRSVDLPYKGEIMPQENDTVKPDDLVAVNRFNPPRLFIVNGFTHFPEITPQQIAQALKVKVGDSLDFDQNYAVLPPEVKTSHFNKAARHPLSPVRGRIDFIDPNTGIMVLSEIQDYSSRPVKVHYAKKLLLSPKLAKHYLHRQVGDFVYQGEVLAKRLEKVGEVSVPAFVKAPSTGTITDIDTENGVLTIAYKHNPLEFPAHVAGSVINVEPGRSLQIAYRGDRLEGKIAFGRECHGSFTVLSDPSGIDSALPDGCIAALAFTPTAKELSRLAERGVRGAVCLGIESGELVSFLGFEPGVINTGNESLPLALLILGGFGTQAMPAPLASALASYSSCYLNPHTRIRAGVVRPFVCFQTGV